MTGTTGLESAASAVTGLDMENQALTESMKEREVLKTHKGKFLLCPVLFLRMNRRKFRNQVCGRIGTDARMLLLEFELEAAS